MRVTVAGAASYYCSELAELSTFLEINGYAQIPTRSQHEAQRWRKAQSLIVVYYNGTILLQGADTDTPRKLFRAAISERLQLPMPLTDDDLPF